MGTLRKQNTQLEKANKVFFTVILPLLLIAAIIEGRNHILQQVSQLLANL